MKSALHVVQTTPASEAAQLKVMVTPQLTSSARGHHTVFRAKVVLPDGTTHETQLEETSRLAALGRLLEEFHFVFGAAEVILEGAPKNKDGTKK